MHGSGINLGIHIDTIKIVIEAVCTNCTRLWIIEPSGAIRKWDINWERNGKARYFTKLNPFV
jgi:hypothetical protein